MIYVIDTDSLIALNRLYKPKFFSELWNQLEQAIEKGVLLSTRSNLTELERKEDDTFFEEWKQNHRNMFIELDEQSQNYVENILARFPDLIDTNSELEQADPYVIALARTKNGAVITEEGSLSEESANNPDRKKKMKIPNVCRYYNILYMKIHEFINSEEWREGLN